MANTRGSAVVLVDTLLELWASRNRALRNLSSVSQVEILDTDGSTVLETISSIANYATGKYRVQAAGANLDAEGTYYDRWTFIEEIGEAAGTLTQDFFVSTTGGASEEAGKWASVDRVKRILRSLPPSGFGKILIGSGTSDSITVADVKQIRDYVEDLVVRKLGWTPTAEFPPVLREMSALYVAYAVWTQVVELVDQDEIPERIAGWKEEADAIYEAIKAGEIDIPGSSVTATLPYPRSRNEIEMVDVPISFTGTTITTLPHTNLRRGSEVVTSAVAQGGTRHVKDTDYRIWYATGEIQVISGGSIPIDGTTLYIAYRYFPIRDFREMPTTVDGAFSTDSYRDRIRGWPT